MNVNCDRVCRLCLSSRGELLPIFPTTSSDQTEPPVLVSKIKDCVAVQINSDDGLPSNVCRKCVDNVNNWHIFKNVCERSQLKLQTFVKKDGNQLEEVKVKSEPLSDEAYDDGVVIDGSYPNHDHNATSSSKVQPEGPPILASLGLTPRSDKTVDPRMDWHRVHAILDIIQADEVIDALQTVEESDVLQQSDHDSDTDIELTCDIDDVFIDCKTGYMFKDHTVMSKDPKATRSYTNARLKEAVQLRKRKAEDTRNCPQPYHAWRLLFSDDMIELIVEATNENIMKRGHYCDTTSVEEVKALIGILYLHGTMRATHQKRSDLWHDKCGVTGVRHTMHLERFKFLLQNLCFDKGADDEDMLQYDTMLRMRKIFEIFALNCRTAYDIETVAVVDEVIVPVYGPCPFKYSIDKKPLKRGMKLVMLVDPNNFYISNLDIITDPYFGPEEIVKKLVQHLSGSGRTIVMDSWFTSRSLMETLKNEYQLYTIAAVNPKDEIVPLIFLSKLRNPRTFMTGFLDNETSLTSYVTTDSKSLNVLTNHPKFYKKCVLNQNTPVSVYKKNQSAVEVVDVLMNYYTTMQCSNDWALSLLFTLLNIASVNAQVLWSVQHMSTSVLQRRLFIRELAFSLMENEYKPEDICLLEPEEAKKKLMLDKSNSLLNRELETRSRCNICVKIYKRRDRKTRKYCIKCRLPICREHTANVCEMCCDL